MTTLPRRQFLATAGAAVATLTTFHARFAQAFFSRTGETVLPWLDQPPALGDPCCDTLLDWEALDTWITPNDKFFFVSHFNRPIINEPSWKLEVDGLVNTPLSLTLADLKARPSKETIFTLECSGNHGFPSFVGGIGNAKWVGTSLADLLKEAGVKDDGIEVVFWGTDVGDVALKDDIRDVTMHQNFARSMSLADAMNPNNMLCYEMNGAALSDAHGFPLRLIAPGWYGIANVKWLKRIEIRDRRFMSLLMGRNYVTIREEDHNGETVWAETSVGRTLLKSVPARVTHSDAGYRISGAAWGAPIDTVEVRIDDGDWQPATFDDSETAEFAWRIWYLDWASPTLGEHEVTSRAISKSGQIQPAMDDPWIAKKHTYWESNGQVTRHIAIT